MSELLVFWDSNEWEDYSHGLLHDRHGAINVMKVPARHKGDFGLDYYCLQERVVYQCYAVQEPCEVADRADKQKAKITTDLTKFCTRPELMALFAGVKINRWILLVPIYDSGQVNIHLTTKMTQVRQKRLPYAADDFEVLIQDLDYFDKASRQARAAQRQIITIPVQPATQADIDNWTQAWNPLVTALSTKLRKRIGSDDVSLLNEAVQQSVGWFLERDNVLDTLRRDAPQLHEELVGVISRHAAKLSLFGKPTHGTAHEILRFEMETLVNELKLSVPNFSAESAQKIALGTIVDWLLRCPLDFPPYGHAA